MQTFMTKDSRGWTVLTLHCPECNRSTQQAADIRKLPHKEKNEAVYDMDQRLRVFFRKSWPDCAHAKAIAERW